VVLWCATCVVFFVNLQEKELHTNRQTNIPIEHKYRYLNSKTTEQVGPSGNAFNLYSGGAWFESRLGAPAILTEAFRGFFQSLGANARVVLLIKQWPLFFALFSIYLLLSFNYSSLLSSSQQRKLQINKH
jgi:hypothetical protein